MHILHSVILTVSTEPTCKVVSAKGSSSDIAGISYPQILCHVKNSRLTLHGGQVTHSRNFLRCSAFLRRINFFFFLFSLLPI